MAKKRRQKQQQQRNKATATAAAAAAAAQPPLPLSEDVNDSDDEEIDEDEAFNSDDERKYGMFFSSSPDDHDDDRKLSAKTKISNGGDGSDESGSEVEDSDDDSDESDDDDDDEDGDGGQYMLDLLDKLGDDTNNKKGKKDDNQQQYPPMVAHVKESAYSSSVVPSAGLTMDALMQDLKDTKGFGALAKTMKVIVSKQQSGASTGGTGATLAPLPRVQSDRLQRQIGYAQASDKMSREWMETVQENRKAETLDFRGHLQQEVRNKITAARMVETFTPTTDFEKEIHDALQQAGQLEEESILQAEHEAMLRQHAQDGDDLGNAELTVEDLAQRRAQLAKMRALMFYHEQKRHHMNKIKSKKYRRIRKRQAERLKQADLDAQVAHNPDLEHELQEKEHVERMKERMTLAHKNTSKWAKRILKRSKKGHGASVDVDTRRALSAQLKRGDDLLQKMKSRNDNDDGDSSNDDDDYDDDEDLVETARKVLAEAENEENDDDDAADTSSRPGLFKLAFMQRGIEKQKQQAREEARQLLEELKADRELEQQDNDDDNDNDNARGNEASKHQTVKKKASPPPVASRLELKDILKEGGEMTTSRSASSAIAVSGNIQIDMGGDNDDDDDEAAATKKEEPVSLRSEHTSMLESTGVTSSNSSPPPPKKGSKLPKAKQASVNLQSEPHNYRDKDKDNENENPWLAAVADNDHDKKKKTDQNKKSSKSKNMVDVDRAVDLLEPHSSATTGASTSVDSKKRKSCGNSGSAEGDNDGDKEQPEEAKKITHLTQEELVRRAFASSALDADDDFAQEKAIVEEREDPLYKKKLADQKTASCKGWGSWAGKGAAIAPPPPPGGKKSKSLPAHLQPPAKKKQKKNDDNMDPNKRKRRDGGKEHLIIRERRVKRMADQYMLHQVPYPYACRQDYERAMTGGIGPEWNVTQSVKDLTRPEICTRAGKIIEPLSQQAKKINGNKKRKNPTSAKF